MNYQKFENWLRGYGCEILPATNDYEAIRWKGKQVGVIYNTGRVSGKYAAKAWDCYKNGKSWDGAPISTGRNGNYRKEKAQLIERDGTRCFFCHKELGDDITLEHLQPLSSGGKNHLNNMVLAHKKCNHAANRLNLIEKIKIAVNSK